MLPEVQDPGHAETFLLALVFLACGLRRLGDPFGPVGRRSHLWELEIVLVDACYEE